MSVWRSRCYEADIPDEVPVNVMKSGRAPSYKAIAMALLKNDLQLFSLGFSKPPYERVLQLMSYVNKPESKRQLSLF